MYDVTVLRRDLRAAVLAVLAFVVVLSISVLVAFALGPNPDYAQHTNAASGSVEP